MAVGLFRGPQHVIEYLDDAARQYADGHPVPLGIPLREAAVDSKYAPLIAVMDDVFATGWERGVETPTGVLWVMPRLRRGRVIGVATKFQLGARLAQPQPVPIRERSARRSGEQAG
jgi:hypothetical protein